MVGGGTPTNGVIIFLDKWSVLEKLRFGWWRNTNQRSKRFKDDVKEVATGYECGLNIERFNDIEVDDIIEGYEMVEVKK